MLLERIHGLKVHVVVDVVFTKVSFLWEFISFSSVTASFCSVSQMKKRNAYWEPKLGQSVFSYSSVLCTYSLVAIRRRVQIKPLNMSCSN